MKWSSRFGVSSAVFLLGIACADLAQGAGSRTETTEPERAAIERTLASYNAALNGGDTAAVLPLYTDDGVFMAPFSRPAIGKAAVKKAYDNVFGKLKFDVAFDIAEVVRMSPTWAYVRTNSAGTTVHSPSGAKTAEGNQELFVMNKGSDGRWRIARYSFSPTASEPR